MTNTFASLIEDAVNASFKGWNFDFVKKRILEEPTSWDYRSLILKQIRATDTLLDLDTGGGEFLSALVAAINCVPQITATEKYKPNIPIARQTLQVLNIKVIEVDDDKSLPFSDNTFDWVINRHGSFDADEIYRILAPGGKFITQQVGSKNNIKLNKLFSPPNFSTLGEWTLDKCSTDLVAAGFTLEQSLEEYPKSVFKDVGAIVYYLKAIPWQIPGFDVKSNLAQLQRLHEEIALRGQLEMTTHRFLVQCTANKL